MLYKQLLVSFVSSSSCFLSSYVFNGNVSSFFSFKKISISLEMMTSRLRAQDSPSSAVTLPEHSAGSRRVVDPPQLLVHPASSQRRRQQPPSHFSFPAFQRAGL